LHLEKIFLLHCYVNTRIRAAGVQDQSPAAASIELSGNRPWNLPGGRAIVLRCAAPVETAAPSFSEI